MLTLFKKPLFWVRVAIVSYILFAFIYLLNMSQIHETETLHTFTQPVPVIRQTIIQTEIPLQQTETPEPTETPPIETKNKIQIGGVKQMPIAHKLSYPSKEEVLKTSTCQHTIYRDYDLDPISFIGRDSPHIACPFPCVKSSTKSGDIVAVKPASSSCTHSKTFERTMENVGGYIGNDNHIAGNSHLVSDVPMQYFNWIEYDLMQQPIPKTAKAMMAAFISNCGPKHRLQYMNKLMEFGVSIHSYGSCNKNMDDGGKHLKKRDVIREYKFTFAFENSETEDYVTEKLMEPLVAGSVPVYFGAPNAYKYAPNNHSVIFVQDFKSPKELADYLKLLDSNDELYNQYLTWKYEGPTQDFIAHMDLSIVHSECRFCIRAADIDRKNVGEVVTGPFQQENEQEMEKYDGKPALLLKVRERGTFYLRYIHIEEYTVSELYKKIYQKYNDPTKGKIHSVYELWNREKTPIQTDQHLKKLNVGHELEIIFENPDSMDRGSYSTWYQNKKKKS